MLRRWKNRLRWRDFVITTGWILFIPSNVNADEPTTRLTATQAQAWKQITDSGLEYLQSSGQDSSGSLSPEVGPGITALAVTAAIRLGRPVDDAFVAKGLSALEGFVKPDGGIYGSGRLRNYETCVAMLCFSEANASGKYNKILQDAKKFVTDIQFGSTRSPDDPWYGGVGYSGTERPDLSNTSYFIEALRSTEEGPDSESIQRALAFVSRCQNLASEGNDTAFAGLVGDGGFYYVVPKEKVDPSTSPERYTENGGLRSYGSMTYAGLKSMIYAGLTPEDPRVKSAVQWIENHYDVTANPGMGDAGLFYYYHTFAASLSTANVDTITTEDGQNHAWRSELIAHLGATQNPDGSWSNRNARWFEDNKNLATSFALLALAHCKPAKPKGDK